MIKTVFYQMARRDWIWLFVIAAVLSLCGTFGTSYVTGEGYPAIPLWAELLISLGLTPVVAGVFFLLDVAFAKFEKGSELRSQRQREFERLIPKWSVKSIAIFTLIMVVLWTPWFIANYPGAAYWDTYYQIFQVYPENHPIAVIPWGDAYDRTLTDAWLVDHHPVVVTMIYGLFGWLSDQLTGTWMIGVALFCGIQGILHCIAFTASVAYLRRIGCSPALCFVTYLFFALMPFVPTWAMCMVKDSMFGLFYVPYFMMLIETVRTRGQFLTKRSHFVWFVVLAVVLCIVKKQGIFVIVATSLIGFIAFWWRRRKDGDGKGVPVANGAGADPVATGDSAKDASVAKDPARTACWAFLWQAAASLLVLVVIFPLILFPALNIESGGKQEALGPLFQQTARYLVDHGDEVTDEEREAISAVLDYDKIIQDYSFNFEDSVKYRYNIEATNDDLLRYLGVYVQQGLKHPDSYFGAWMGLAGYYVAPTAIINIRMTTVDTYMGGESHELPTSDSSEGGDSSSSSLTSEEANAILNSAIDKAVAEGKLSEGQQVTPELLAEVLGDDIAVSSSSSERVGDEIERHMLWNPSELEGMRTGMDELYAAIGRIPVINFALLIVTYALWLPALLIYVAQRRRMGSRVALALTEDDAPKTYQRGAWTAAADETASAILSPANASGYAWVILLIPQLVLLAFCIIAPVYDGRYVIPIFDIAPLLYCGMCVLLKQRDHSRDEALEREAASKALGAKSRPQKDNKRQAKSDKDQRRTS